MKYLEERSQLVSVIEDLIRRSMLDCAGGAVSLRLSSGDLLMSTTASAFRRWKVGVEDFIVLAPDGRIVEQTRGLGASGTPIHLAIYEQFPACGAVIHAHSPYSLAFASLGVSLPSCTNQLDTLGEVPCLAAADAAVKASYLANPIPFDMPEGIVQRADVAAVNVLHLVPQLVARLGPRRGELERHGLAFLVYRHGVFAFARLIDEAFDNLHRVEVGARTALYQATLKSGMDGIDPNLLFSRPDS